MKPRNKYERQVAASNVKLTAIPTKAVSWAVRNLIEHPAFRTSGHKCTCGDCGKPFDYKGKGKIVRCPHCKAMFGCGSAIGASSIALTLHKHCGGRLKVTDTRKRKIEASVYFSVLQTVDGLQVQRTFLLNAFYQKGEAMRTEHNEVFRLWMNAQGKFAVTARMRTTGYYLDNFSWCTDIELRRFSDIYWQLANNNIYPHYSAIPELRRNGLKGKLPDCHPARLMQLLLTDTRIETMMKAGNHKAVVYYASNLSALDFCWNSFKIAKRHGYEPESYEMWSDTIRLLDKLGKDIRSTKYICPDNLKVAHDHWLKKVREAEERERNKKQLQRTKEQEAEFYKQKSCFFGIVIKDNDLEISVLNSLEAYQAEGNELHHCVFQCEYYAKTDSVILSAHNMNGRIETVEFSLTEGRVIQSRGVCNSNTEYHDRIIELVNSNAHLFMEAQRTA